MSPDEPGQLAAAVVRELLLCDSWVRIEGGGETGSTNDDARELALAGAPEGTVVLASRQRAGRGRFGRTWDSPTGGVYLSVVLRPRGSASVLPALPLAIGLGVVFGLERLGAAPTLKWPNDVLLDGDKVAGVLVESRTDMAGEGWSIAGIGLNVRRPETPGWNSGSDVTFLGDVLPDVTLSQCAAAVLDGIAEAYRRFVSGGFAALREDYLSRSATLGTKVSVSDAFGAIVAEGEAIDVDEAGRLVVVTAAGTLTVASGEVSLRSLQP